MSNHWKIKYDYDTRFYFIEHSITHKKIKIPRVTEQEIKDKCYQQYYDKAYIACEKANGKTVYLYRHVNGKPVTYLYKAKHPKKG